MNSLESLIAGLKKGDRRCLAQSITLAESSLPSDRNLIESLYQKFPRPAQKTIRIGISGMPGVGKSSIIEQLGLRLIHEHKFSVAVLAIDPTSPLTGGSILGDKTRMEYLSREQRAFIRPSPSGDSSGGVARRTREAIWLCEAAGYDVVILETVGVGQAEYSAAQMVDLFVVVQLPGSGDELQGIKKGILELSDLIVINKADGTLKPLAELAKTEHERAMSLVRHASEQPPIILCSTIEKTGVAELTSSILKINESRENSGEKSSKREFQAIDWYRQEIWLQIRDRAMAQTKQKSLYNKLEDEVRNFRLVPSLAAKDLIEGSPSSFSV